MNPTQYSTDFTQLLFQPPLDEMAITGWFVDAPLPATSALSNVRSQLPHTVLPETSMGTLSTQDVVYGVVQDSYPPLRHAFHSSHIPHQTSIASFDNNVRGAQWNENSGMEYFSVAAPVALPPIPSPSPPPILAPRWFKVPQRIYEHGNTQWNFRPSEPIPFSVNGIPGINMQDALHKRFTDLDGRDDPMLRGAPKTVSCRFLFPGYPSRFAQISTLSWAKNRVPITRSKLAYEVAKKLSRYLESMAGYPMDRSTDNLWRIGERSTIRLENLFLVCVAFASTGSIQPEIWVWVP